MKVAVVGLGKLGIPMASLFALHGHTVVGVEVDQDKIELINKRQNPIPAEPNVTMGGNIFATNDYERLTTCDMIFIAVNTPPMPPQNDLNMKDLMTVCEKITETLKNDKGKHIVIVSSTVPPRTMAAVKRVLNPIPVVYNPFFIALGQVVNDLQFPDIVLVGSDDPESRHRVAGFWADIIGGTTRIRETNLITAELVKFGLTPYLVMRINWANTIARIAESVGDVDAQQVIDIIGMDRRINTRNLKLGLPWGGDCYPKDVNAFIYFCNTQGIDPTFLEGLVKVNDQWKGYLPKIIMDKACRSDFRNAKIALLGISYKKTYPLLNMSTPYEIYRYFVDEKAKVFVHDPYIETLLDGTKTKPLMECLKDAELVIVTVAYPEYRLITTDALPENVPVVDLCRGMETSAIARQGKWLPLGFKEQ